MCSGVLISSDVGRVTAFTDSNGARSIVGEQVTSTDRPLLYYCHTFWCWEINLVTFLCVSDDLCFLITERLRGKRQRLPAKRGHENRDPEFYPSR